ncbi:hypothetical protein QBC38DRAFT_359971 [Podospora fimiseda]|uniref:Uncharacterized protein n=1 Tax=Podospora fimiseda TaxID=252190 RepID=A0AAN7H660_9PEZI|nr:hypothetical protein QBC38DRAFT_359971 [Podospora fimiseda]
MPIPPSPSFPAATTPTSSSRKGKTTNTTSSLQPSPPILRKKLSAGILTTSTDSATGKTTARITTTYPTPGTSSASANTTTTDYPSRRPLKLRDQNAPSTLRGMKSGFDLRPGLTPRMPSYERVPNTGSRQSPMPIVAGRSVNTRPPLTPKIASARGSPNPTLATPLPRRPRPESVLSANGIGSRDREELTSPVSAFLASNITPRSGSRQSRVESSNTTPSGTPGLDRRDSWDARSGLGITSSPPEDREGLRRPLVTFSPASEVSGTGSRPDLESKFFYASDAPKPPPQQSAQSRPHPTLQQNPGTFFYANGGAVPERQSMAPGPFSPALASPMAAQSPHAPDSLMSKFIYANGTPELQPAAKIASPSHSGSGSGSGSVVSTSSKIPTNKNGNTLRPTSPMKPYPIGIKTGNNSNVASPLVSPRSPTAPIRTRNRQSSHGKSTDSQASTITVQSTRPRPKSLTVAEPPVVAKLMSNCTSAASSAATSPSDAAHPLPDTFFTPASSGFASLLQAAEDFVEGEDDEEETGDDDDEDDDDHDSQTSPNKQSPQEKELTDLVASARRERKVQDLQITNASLEAINRTLEKQLRKQTAELRRFKRLSRSGRLSLTSLNSRIPSGSTVDGGLIGPRSDLNDLSEEGSDLEEEDPELEESEEEEDDSEDADSLNAAPKTEKEARRRQRDEERLQVDLTKHQQLLIDSQKMNQSLRRCLGWTEELIKEGKRALAYQVTLGESELGGKILTAREIGGRILTAEEIEKRNREAETETNLSDDEDYQNGLSTRPDSPVEDDRSWNKAPQDRDSGIELSRDGE